MKPAQTNLCPFQRTVHMFTKRPISLEELAFHWEGTGIGFVKPYGTRSWFGSYGNIDVEAQAARHTLFESRQALQQTQTFLTPKDCTLTTLILKPSCAPGQLATLAATQQKLKSGMGSKGNSQGLSEPVVGVPVHPSSSSNNVPVVSEGFCVPHDVVFVLQSNVNPRSTEIYNVIDSAGAPQFRVFAVNDSGSRMHIVDREGRVVLSLKSKFFSAHNKWYIYSGNSTHKEDKIATVKPQTGSVTAEVFLKGKARRNPDAVDSRGKKAKAVADFLMEGNRTVTYGKISHQEDGYSRPVSELNKINHQIQRGQPIPNHIDAYSLHTLPGVDSVFMLAVTVALDEALFSPQQLQPYGPYNRYGYGGYGYGGFGYGAPLLLGAGLLATPFLFGGFW